MSHTTLQTLPINALEIVAYHLHLFVFLRVALTVTETMSTSSNFSHFPPRKSRNTQSCATIETSLSGFFISQPPVEHTTSAQSSLPNTHIKSSEMMRCYCDTQMRHLSTVLIQGLFFLNDQIFSHAEFAWIFSFIHKYGEEPNPIIEGLEDSNENSIQESIVILYEHTKTKC